MSSDGPIYDLLCSSAVSNNSVRLREHQVPPFKDHHRLMIEANEIKPKCQKC